MKKANFGFLAAALAILSFTSCDKIEDFPDLLVGNWQSDKVTIGGEDVTPSYAFTLNLEDSREFDLDVTSKVPFTGVVTQSFSGDWTEDEPKQDIKLTYSTTGEEKIWDVKSIDKTGMTVELIENGIRYSVHFAK